MLERKWRKGSPRALLVELYIGAATMEHRYGDSSKS